VEDNRQPINELKLNLLGKIFLGTLSAWLVGKTVNTKLRGSRVQIEAVASVMNASRKFQEEMHKPDASVESVMRALGEKHLAASHFEKTLGVPWPL